MFYNKMKFYDEVLLLPKHGKSCFLKDSSPLTETCSAVYFNSLKDSSKVKNNTTFHDHLIPFLFKKWGLHFLHAKQGILF